MTMPRTNKAVPVQKYIGGFIDVLKGLSLYIRN